MQDMHSLLRRQILREFGELEQVPLSIRGFLLAVSQTYSQFDADRALLERSMDLSSRELVQANSDMNAIFRVLPDLFFRCSDDGTVLDCRAGAGTDILVAPHSLIGKRLQDIPIPALARSIDDAFARVLATRAAISIEYDLRDVGHDMHHEARLLPLENDQIIIVVRDVSVRRQAEAALRQSNQQIHLLLDSTAEAIYGVDITGICTFVNRACLSVLGFTDADALIGKNVHALIHHSHADGSLYPAEECKIYRAYHLGIGEHCDTEVFWRADGTSIQVEYWSHPVVKDGQVVGAVATFLDISDRRRLEREREEMEVQLRHAQKLESIGQLAAGVAHEINTPIQFIGDNIQFLTDAFRQISDLLGTLPRPDQKDDSATNLAQETGKFIESARQIDLQFLNSEIPLALEQTLQGVDRVATIVRAMKDFSHPDLAEKVPIDINKALQTTLTMARNEVKYVAEVETQYSEALPAVSGYPGELNQVFLNLLVNAAHAISDAVGDTGNRGRITVQTSITEDGVLVAIGDSGTGIPLHIRHRIFDPFFTTKEVGKGTGQGLSIARAVIVDKHQGKIWFDSRLGVGTTFYVLLPTQEVVEGVV